VHLSSCARCGAPLPVVAADPNHPEWCAPCASRAFDAPTAPPPGQVPWGGGTTPATAPVRTSPRIGDGLLVGLAAAGIGAVAWWALATFGEVEQWHYLSVVVGIVVGQGVLLGARRGGPVPGLLAAVLSAAAVLVTAYFIDRSFQILDLDASGLSSDIPLWQGATAFVDVVTGWVEFDLARAGGWLLAPLAAAVIAGWPGRRPGLGRG
jgi:hypothetical protein